MSKFVSGLLGTVALVASLGATQFAAGNDLRSNPAEIAAVAQTASVNRLNKTDRTASPAAILGSNTLTKVSASNDTSVVIRLPGHVSPQARLVPKTSSRPVACEAPASVLTDIAKQMASGRCVT